MNEISWIERKEYAFNSKKEFGKRGIQMQLVSFGLKMNVFEIDIKVRKDQRLVEEKKMKKIQQDMQIREIQEERRKMAQRYGESQLF